MTHIDVFRATSMRITSRSAKTSEGKPYEVNEVTVDTTDGQTIITIFSETPLEIVK